MPPAPDPLETIRDVLQRGSLQPRPISGEPGFTITIGAGSAEAPPVDGAVYLLPDEQQVVCYLTYRERAEARQRRATAEFIARANYGITIGNFEMDYESGAVRYKTSLDFRGCELPPLMVRSLIVSAMAPVKVYSAALASVMRGERTARAAIGDAEG